MVFAKVSLLISVSQTFEISHVSVSPVVQVW